MYILAVDFVYVLCQCITLQVHLLYLLCIVVEYVTHKSTHPLNVLFRAVAVEYVTHKPTHPLNVLFRAPTQHKPNPTPTKLLVFYTHQTTHPCPRPPYPIPTQLNHSPSYHWPGCFDPAWSPTPPLSFRRHCDEFLHYITRCNSWSYAVSYLQTAYTGRLN